jgi:uncharacterized membrane protein YphA (DoxX/SURF4 family)
VTSPAVIAAVQGPVLGVALVASGAAKLRMGRQGLKQTAFVRLLSKWNLTRGSHQAWATWLAVALVEVLLGISLLSGVAPRLVGCAAALLFFLASAYVAWAVRFESGSSCGCFSARVPASWTSVARAVCLCGAAVGYAWNGTGIWQAAPRPFPTIPVAPFVAVELVALFLLSTELRGEALLYIRAVRRLVGGRATTARSFGVVLAQARVESTRFWSEHIKVANSQIAPRVIDSWVAGPWTYNEYAGSWYGQPATIVTAVLSDDASWRLAASVETGPSGTIVAAYDSGTERERSQKRKRQTAAPAASNLLAAS